MTMSILGKNNLKDRGNEPMEEELILRRIYKGWRGVNP
jgi:hypothetical protein